MVKIAVVGLGWMGLPLALSLKESGYEISGTCTSPHKQHKLQGLGLEVHLFDLNDYDEQKAKACFSEANYCFLNIPPSKIDKTLYADRCLELVQLFPDSCKFIFASSTGVYYDCNKIINETAIEAADLNPENPVRKAEILLQEKLKNRLAIIRFAGLFGADRNPARYFAGKKAIPNGMAPVNLVHLDDCIALIELVIRRDFFGKIMHACADNHPTKSQFYTQECQKLKLDQPEFEQELISWKIIDNSWSKEQLGFQYRENFLNF